MTIGNLLDFDRIKTPLEARSADEAIREMAESLCKAGMIENSEAIINAVMERESMGSTGLGKGIAVPHARSPEVKEPYIFLGISPRGIDFNALDGEPSRLFFLILAAPDQSSQHIQLLSQIAGLSANDDLLDRLCHAADAEEALILIRSAGL